MNYDSGDRVFLFGYSRGAFTVRSLAGMVGRCGLIDRDILLNARCGKERERILRKVLHAYRSAKVIRQNEERVGGGNNGGRETGAMFIRNELGLSNLNPRSIPIHLIGVRDTVDAVGVPVDELKPILDRLSRGIRKRRLWGFHDLRPHPCIQHAYQALALDDERRTFHPLVWEVKNSIRAVSRCGEGCTIVRKSKPMSLLQNCGVMGNY